MSTGRCIVILIVGAAIAFGASVAWAWEPGGPPSGTGPTETGPTTTTPTPTTTEPTPPPSTGTTPAPTPPPTTTPTQPPSTGCGLTSAGVVCPGSPGNPSCVITSAGVTCATNCVITSAGLVCPRGQVLANPPVRGGPKSRKRKQARARKGPSAPAGAVSPTTIPVAQRTGGRELPFTGQPLLPLFALGLALVAGGVLLLRRGASTAVPAAECPKEAAPIAIPSSGRRRSSQCGRVVQALAVLAVLLWQRRGR
jgi:hypothetical protein